MFKVEVVADSSGKWCGNALTYPTADLARDAAESLFSRWMLVRSWRVVQISDGHIVHHHGAVMDFSK